MDDSCNHRNKAAFSNSSSVAWTGPERPNWLIFGLSIIETLRVQHSPGDLFASLKLRAFCQFSKTQK